MAQRTPVLMLFQDLQYFGHRQVFDFGAVGRIRTNLDHLLGIDVDRSKQLLRSKLDGLAQQTVEEEDKHFVLGRRFSGLG